MTDLLAGATGKRPVGGRGAILRRTVAGVPDQSPTEKSPL